VLITVTLLLAVACLAPAGGKLLAHPKMQASAVHFGIPWSRYRLIGVAELAAVAGILAGLVVPAIGVAAAVGMIVLLVGALVAHKKAGDNPKDAIPAFVALGLSAAYLVILLTR
jgi:4-hydroxybenzoate polyprenyltransferase